MGETTACKINGRKRDLQHLQSCYVLQILNQFPQLPSPHPERASCSWNPVTTASSDYIRCYTGLKGTEQRENHQVQPENVAHVGQSSDRSRGQLNGGAVLLVSMEKVVGVVVGKGTAPHRSGCKFQI